MPGGKIQLPDLLRKQQTSLFLGVALLVLWTLVGTIGFTFIEGWSLFDSFYMTILTISTVGYGEVHPLTGPGRIFTSLLIVLGISTAVYTFTRLGQVVLENDHELEGDLQDSGHLYLIGDATDESVLQSAGLDQAKAVLALLASDADNLFLTITAKELSPSVMVIARAFEDKVEPRLKHGGADKVISPYQSACARVLQAAIRPAVVEFLELATHREYMHLGLEEIRVCENSLLSGGSLAEGQVLGLHQHYPKTLVEEAIGRVLELQCPSLASIRHWISYRKSSTQSIEPLPPELIPGITDRQVERMAVARFNALLGSRG